jgi:hypothetical protein
MAAHDDGKNNMAAIAVAETTIAAMPSVLIPSTPIFEAHDWPNVE